MQKLCTTYIALRLVMFNNVLQRANWRVVLIDSERCLLRVMRMVALWTESLWSKETVARSVYLSHSI